MDNVLAAVGNVTLQFRDGVRFTEDEVAKLEIAAKLAAALDGVGVERRGEPETPQ